MKTEVHKKSAKIISYILLLFQVINIFVKIGPDRFYISKNDNKVYYDNY